MSLASTLHHVAAPVALAALGLSSSHSAIAQQAPQRDAVDQSCSRVFNPERGAQSGDCYSREEAAKFICLDVTAGRKDPACSIPEGQMPTYVASKGQNLLILTTDFAKKNGLVVEREAGTYMVHQVTKNPDFERTGDTTPPSWAATRNVAPAYNELLAMAHCKGETGCSSYERKMDTVYKDGGQILAGGRLQSTRNGKTVDGNYFVFRVGQNGIAAMDIVDNQGASFFRGTYSSVKSVDSVLAKVAPP